MKDTKFIDQIKRILNKHIELKKYMMHGTFLDKLKELSIQPEIKEFDTSTRTAALLKCGCFCQSNCLV